MRKDIYVPCIRAPFLYTHSKSRVRVNTQRRSNENDGFSTVVTSELYAAKDALTLIVLHDRERDDG
jgi:hypothetical protein